LVHFEIINTIFKLFCDGNTEVMDECIKVLVDLMKD